MKNFLTLIVFTLLVSTSALIADAKYEYKFYQGSYTRFCVVDALSGKNNNYPIANNRYITSHSGNHSIHITHYIDLLGNQNFHYQDEFPIYNEIYGFPFSNKILLGRSLQYDFVKNTYFFYDYATGGARCYSFTDNDSIIVYASLPVDDSTRITKFNLAKNEEIASTMIATKMKSFDISFTNGKIFCLCPPGLD